MKETATFVLYGHVYCHLCDDMEAALVALLQKIGNGKEFVVDVIDIDQYPDLEERFGERVPVLVADGRELCHYFLDHAAVRAYLAEIR